MLRELKQAYMDKITTYLKNTRAELTHVNWPTQREITSYTVIVIAISLLVAGMLGLFDVMLVELIRTIS